MADSNPTLPGAEDVVVALRPARGLRHWLDQRRQELPAWTASLFIHLALIAGIPALGPTPREKDRWEEPLLEAVLANPIDWQHDTEAGQGLQGDTAGAFTLQATFASSSPRPTPSQTAGQQDQLEIDPASSSRQAQQERPRDSSKAVARLDAQIEYVQNRLTQLTARIAHQSNPRAQTGDSQSLRNARSTPGHDQHAGRDTLAPQGQGAAHGSHAPDGSDEQTLAGGRGKQGQQPLGEGSRSRSPPLPLVTYTGNTRGNLWVWQRRQQRLQQQKRELEARREREARQQKLEQQQVAGEIAVLNNELQSLQRKRQHLLEADNADLSSADKPGDLLLVSDQSAGFYNDALGSRLDGSRWNRALSGGQYDTRTDSPDLTAVADVLGGWLQAEPPAGRWLMMAPIPATWNAQQETAIVYEVQNNTTDDLELLATFAARDSGVFVWVDGRFRLGSGYGAGSFQLTRTPLGTIPPGTHYIQILRESDASQPQLHVRLVGRKITR